MEELDLKNNAMILFDSYLEDGRKLLESLRKIGVDCRQQQLMMMDSCLIGWSQCMALFLENMRKVRRFPDGQGILMRSKYRITGKSVEITAVVRFMISTDYGARSSIRSLRIRGW